MSNDELMLIISVTADDVAQTEKEIAAKVAHNKADTAARIAAVKVREAAATSGYCLNCECHSNGLTFSTDWDMLICPDCASDKADYEANPPKALDTINDHDAPHFCPACEGYCKTDEMTASAWVTALICIDCATAEENALSATLTGIDCKIVIDMRPLIDGNRRRQAMIESVLEMNYIGGHLPGYHFTPTLKELPRNLFAYQPNNGRPGSPNAIINTLGYYIVNLRRGFDTRALYDCLGHYVIHGDYDVINAYLIDLQGGV
ncbi:MAG: hypothetical protein JKX78_03020 [Alteromonadaceae bacterium]|nr:hypothetical protein [Alteromonadaceae bacterium]